MSDQQKLDRLKILLGISGTAKDALLNEYLSMSKAEILNWLYTNTGIPEDVTDVPAKYEQVQIQACVAGFNIIGAEGELVHSENGVSTTFKYEDMVAYIHSHVYPFVGVM